MYYYSGVINNDISLKLSPLTSALARLAGPEYEGAGGYFLYRSQNSDPGSIEILAKIPTDEAAFQLSRLLGLE